MPSAMHLRGWVSTSFFKREGSKIRKATFRTGKWLFFSTTYRRGDSNPHALRHTHLKRARLPIPPLRYSWLLSFAPLKIIKETCLPVYCPFFSFSLFFLSQETSRTKQQFTSLTNNYRNQDYEKCPGLDSNQHARSAPPPQDGVSTNFTTRAKEKNVS